MGSKFISNYSVIWFKRCPQCLRLVQMVRKQCDCGYTWSCLCEGCGRDTKGSLFCSECIQPGKYHWGRYSSYNRHNRYKRHNRKKKFEKEGTNFGFFDER